MNRVLTIGIDALDAVLLSKFEKDLPNFRKLRRDSPNIKSISVFPPDSNTAWASIHTGLNPAKHGIVHFMDPLERITKVSSGDIDNSPLKGRTYWDYASKYGKRVCIIFPHLGYPVWSVNGVMIGRSAVRNDAKILTYPKHLSGEFDLSHLNVIPGFAKGDLDEYIKKAKKLVIDETKFGLKIFKDYEWNLFHMYSSVLDTICHNFWNYCDENDPTYPGKNPYKNVIKEFYKLYDEMVGKFMKKIDSDTIFMVFSDHGHGMRPVKIVNINEFLRMKEFLKPKVGNTKNPIFIIEILKKKILNIISKYRLGSVVLKLIKLFPRAKELYTYPLLIDWDKTVAYEIDLSGIKAYSYGGIKIIKENLKNMEYEELRSILVKELSELKDPKTGERLMLWVCKREDLYSGQFIDKYPDIVFQLREDYGAGNAIHDSLITKSTTHNVVPGSHKMYTPVFLISNLDDEQKQNIGKNMTIMDIAPTILDLLGIDWRKFEFDGRSLV